MKVSLFAEAGLLGVLLLLLTALVLLVRRQARWKQRMESWQMDWERTVESKNRAITILSHEVLTPLRYISAITRRELSRGLPPGDTRQALEKIGRAASTLYQVSQNVVGWMKSQEDRMVFSNEPVFPARVGQAVIDLLSDLAENKRNRILNAIPGDLRLHTDRSMLQIVLLNLLSNAIKFTDRGQITLEACCENGAVRMTVRDTGTGFPEDTLRRLRGPLASLPSTPGTQAEAGNGMGFTIVRHFLSLLGGSLEIESRPGAGAAVTVTLRDEYAAA